MANDLSAPGGIQPCSSATGNLDRTSCCISATCPNPTDGETRQDESGDLESEEEHVNIKEKNFANTGRKEINAPRKERTHFEQPARFIVENIGKLTSPVVKTTRKREIARDGGGEW
jgi:hypothetical protein